MEPQSDQELDLYISEFTSSKDNWTNLSLEQLSKSYQLEINNSNREFNLTLHITTISAAFLTVVVPLIDTEMSGFLVIAEKAFLATLLFGILKLMITLSRDRRLIKEGQVWMHDKLMGYVSLASSICLDLYDYKRDRKSKSWSDIEVKIKKYFNSKEGLNEEVLKRENKKAKEFSAIVGLCFYWLFWAGFGIALFSLTFWSLKTL